MGSRRCRRPIAGLCDWGAGELLGGVVPYWMSLSSYEATMSLSEQFLWSTWDLSCNLLNVLRILALEVRF